MIALKSLDLPGIDQLARQLAEAIPAPLAIGLVGTLGAGKTTMTQAIARAIGVDDREVTSPTFTLMQTHHGKFVLHHLDAYRIADEDEFLELGVEELFEQGDAWVIVEWADRVRSVMPDRTLWVAIDIESESSRRITLQSNDAGLIATCNQITAL